MPYTYYLLLWPFLQQDNRKAEANWLQNDNLSWPTRWRHHCSGMPKKSKHGFKKTERVLILPQESIRVPSLQQHVSRLQNVFPSVTLSHRSAWATYHLLPTGVCCVNACRFGWNRSTFNPRRANPESLFPLPECTGCSCGALAGDVFKGRRYAAFTYPHENEHFGIADSVLALRDAHHRELWRAGALFHQITNLWEER